MENYFSEVKPQKYELDKLLDTHFLATLLSLINYTEVLNNTKKKELKLKLFNELQTENRNKNLSDNCVIYLNKSFKYGNTIILLNNLLYYAEILNITNIYLNLDMKWPIKDNITIVNKNISIISSSNINFNDDKIVNFNPIYIYSQKVIIPEIRINLLKNEIFKNLPKLKLDVEDLYIHIRGGDIFKCKRCKDINYSQPPLCFYQKILLAHNSLQNDIATLSNAYNIVGSVSSFLTSLILMNSNLKNFWEYDNYRLTEKYLHLHPEIYKKEIKYNIYKMKASNNYKNKMFPWKNTKIQRDLMLKEKCDDFYGFSKYI